MVTRRRRSRGRLVPLCLVLHVLQLFYVVSLDELAPFAFPHWDGRLWARLIILHHISLVGV